MPEQVCPIWKTPAKVESGPGLDIVDSPRAGGPYKVTHSAIAALRSLSVIDKTRLTWRLVEQRRQGETTPEISSYSLEQIHSTIMPSVIERRDRLLDYIAGSSTTIAPRIPVSGIVTETMTARRASLAAHTASQDHAEVSELIRFAKEDGLIVGAETIHLTFKAWTYIEDRRAKKIASVQGFVAMWFSSSMDEIYENGFAPAIRENKFSPMRIDRKEHINKIDDEIIAEIRRSRFLVADFTSDPNQPRGGVYFEAGFALGLNIPVIWTCREDLVSQLHFDIRQFNQIVWTKSDDLYSKLKNRIGAVLGDGPTS